MQPLLVRAKAAFRPSQTACRRHPRAEGGLGRDYKIKLEGTPDAAEVARLLGNNGGVDLSQGLDLSPQKKTDDPLNYDPEGLFKGNTTLQDGHIMRRQMQKNSEMAEEMQEEMKREQARALAQAQKRRDAAILPKTPNECVDFLLNCDAADIEYFVAKLRQQLDAGFFAALDTRAGEQRMLAGDERDEDALEELLGLRDYVEQTMKAQDAVAKGVVGTTERLKKLLTSKDKKQCILDMAAANEIDVGLIQLLQQNIDGAAASGQAEAAEFMTKVRDACARHVIAAKPNQPSTEEPVVVKA